MSFFLKMRRYEDTKIRHTWEEWLSPCDYFDVKIRRYEDTKIRHTVEERLRCKITNISKKVGACSTGATLDF